MRRIPGSLVRLLAAASLVPLPTSAAFAAWPLSGVPVSSDTTLQSMVGMAEDGAGGAFLSFNDHHYDGAVTWDTLRVQHVLATGARAPGWPAGGVAAAGLVASPPTPPAADGAGGAYVAWCIEWGYNRDLYLQHVDAAGARVAGWPAAGLLVCTARNSQEAPVLLGDGEGGAFLVWSDWRSGQGAIYGARFTPSGALAAGWPANGRALCPASGSQTDPVLVPDGADGFLVLWIEARGASGLLAYAQRVTADGLPAAGWPASGVAVAPAGPPEDQLVAIPDGAGGAFAAWRTLADGNPPWRARAGHVLGIGVPDPAWPDSGAAATSVVPGDQVTPALALDADGLVVVWLDQRDHRPARYWDHGDVWATRLGRDGTRDPRWPGEGTPVARFLGFPPNDYYYYGATALRAATSTDGTAHAGWIATAPDAFSGGFVRMPAAPPPGGLLVEPLSLPDLPRSDELALTVSGSGGPIAAWIQPAGGTYPTSTTCVGRLGGVSTPALASLVSASAGDGVARLTWQVATSAPVSIERALAAGQWREIARRAPDGLGRVSLADADAPRGARVGYRLVLDAGGAAAATGEVWLEVPALHAFALRVLGGSPVVGALRLAVELPEAAPARLELFDVSGRLVQARALAGEGVVTVGALPPGLYLARLTQGARVARARVVALR